MNENDTLVDTLYARKNGKVRIWKILKTGDNQGYFTETGYQYGKLTRSPVRKAEKRYTIDQAIEARIKAQIERKFYVRDVNDYDPESSLLPQLCKDWSKGARPSSFKDLSITPKYDGVRARWSHSRQCFISRQGTEYHIPHLVSALKDVKLPLDGEIYNHYVPFETICSWVRAPHSAEGWIDDAGATYGIDDLVFVIFDVMVEDEDYDNRMVLCRGVVDMCDYKHSPIMLTREYRIWNQTSEQAEFFINRILDVELDLGFEGIVIRDCTAAYQFGKRHNSLLKYKKKQSAEFEIVGHQADVAGRVVFNCKTAEGKPFKAKLSGDEVRSKAYAQSPQSEFIGKMLTVEFFEITSKGAPRFPVAIAIRDYE